MPVAVAPIAQRHGHPAILGCLALALSITAASSAAHAWDPAQATPAFERAPCPAPVPARDRATCGMVTTAIDPNDPTRGRLRLPVAVLHAWRPDPAPEPVLFLDGGPGDMTLGPTDDAEIMTFWMEHTRRLRRDRDVILFDGRGIGESWPSLECPEVEALADDESIIPGDLAQARRRDAAAHLTCRARLRDGGIDLSLYASPAMAADALAVADALGVRAVDLWGVSYGSRVALEMMRRAPERVRAAVLDGVYPPTVAGMETDRARFRAALDQVFAGCRAQDACATAFPDLEATFHRTLARYGRTPYRYPMDRGPDLVVDDRVIVIALLLALYDHEAIPHIPSLLHHLSRDNPDVLEALAAWPELLADDNASEAVYIQLSCTEDWAMADPRRVKEDRRDHPWADAAAMPLVDVLCVDWLDGQAAAPWAVKRPVPVTADVPTLLLSGAFDPATPPQWADEAMRTLPRAHHGVLKNGGHAATFGHACGEWAMLSFLRDPAAPPARCLETTAGPLYRTAFPDLDYFWM